MRAHHIRTTLHHEDTKITKITKRRVCTKHGFTNLVLSRDFVIKRRWRYWW